MTLRIDVPDLPPSQKDGEAAVYRLSCLVGGEYFTYAVAEGETTIGSSTLCAIAVRAPGVHGRHVCLKRHGNKLFVRSLGKGRVFVHGKAVEGPTALSVGEPFTFGSVTAVAECILPQDRQVAVAISPDRVSCLLGEQDLSLPEMAAGQLNGLGDILCRALDGENPAAGEPLLDLLQKSFSPTAGLLIRRRAGGDGSVLWELGDGAGLLRDDPAGKAPCTECKLAAGEDEYEMRMAFADPEPQPWRSAFCRLVLILAVLDQGGRRIQGADAQSAGPLPQTAGASDPNDAWGRMAGGRIRSHLRAQTELCRHADQVLVLGETGTGKELAARSLHELWRRPGAFVAINCAAIGAELLDSELFGVTAGAATGVSARTGRFAQAQGGTLFLDEISEMPLPLQSKLLRVLQEGEYYPVGGKRLEKTDAKVIASSNRSEATLQSEHMRPDLYYRLSQAVVTMPPLRQRVQDLAELCGHILGGLERQFGRNVQGLSVGALESLKRYHWPGNVRELQNRLRNIYMGMPAGSLIRSAHLPPLSQANPTAVIDGTLALRVQQLEREVIQREIDRHDDMAEAAEALGISKGYLYRKIKKLGVVRRK